MWVLVVSDSHGDRESIRQAALEMQEDGRLPGAAIHLGDGASEFHSLEGFFRRLNPAIRLYQVRGNCDSLYDDTVPEAQKITLDGTPIFLTHGHLWGVKMSFLPLDTESAGQGCCLTLFGHTHMACMENRSTVMINPGSIGTGQYAALEVNGGLRHVNLMSLRR